MASWYVRRMKNTLIRSYQDEGGQWWFIQRNGARQRAKVLRCKTCGEGFLTYPGGTRSEFCSQQCMRKTCARCGQLFAPRTNRQVYCSVKCKRRKAKCLECGKEFVPSKNAAGKFCSKRCFYEHSVPTGTIRPDPSGYTIIKVPPGTPGVKLQGKGRGNWMWTHRYVIQQKLGRPLRKSEHVHHINGKRDDNRSENLELWKKAHPSGVRAKDYHCPGCRCFENG